MMNSNTSIVDRQADLLYQVFTCIQEITKQHAAISKILQERNLNNADDLAKIESASLKVVNFCHEMRSHLTEKR